MILKHNKKLIFLLKKFDRTPRQHTKSFRNKIKSFFSKYEIIIEKPKL